MITSWAPGHRSSELSPRHLSTTIEQRRRRVSRNVKDSHRHRQYFEARVRVLESVQVRCQALAVADKVLTAGVERTTQAAQQVLVGARTTGGGPGDSEVVQGCTAW
jgi:hypothetical protein